MNKMTKEQAYNLLNTALASIQTTRQNHNALIEALNILMEPKQETIKEPMKLKEVKE